MLNGIAIDRDNKTLYVNEYLGNESFVFDLATLTNEIGDPVLAAAWTDPDFDSTLNAFYYTRVMKIPTPSGRPMIASSSR